MNKLLNWFYTTWLGNVYFDLLLWLDRRKDRKQLQYMTPKEIAQVVRQYSMLGEGVKEIKSKVNVLVGSKTKEEYDKTLKELDNLVCLAQREESSPQAQYTNILKSGMDFSNSDIKNQTDRAKMVEKRIGDMYELQADKQRRSVIRQIRQAHKQGNTELAIKLQKEWDSKYGRR
jgi:hypothetical protein